MPSHQFFPQMWQYTYGLVVYDALKAFADKIDEWVERQKRKRAREEDAEVFINSAWAVWAVMVP